MYATYEQEKAKIDFRLIFNDEPNNYRFTNTEHLKLVNKYGLYCGDVSKAIRLSELHTQIQLEAATCGIDLDDNSLIKLIGDNYYGG
ncbi:hypothetical protein [Paenibacillus sp. XY044]|uniref:hypothetical protein n=1 Tax=Paenibacillus sp. XY044 TaxID=2026089 RepID=UPI000B9979AF|nr:hypothetical protein [Paenibacillus sp. XY044]OZB98097.1 hypothetical protein CJP46_02715 [Paenibacillus sp. XY044]